ncbi:MAG TPA: peptidylprolyl isomerase [Pyrinomonadaceae bacterium]|jgi:cyclophilin family peptidyl-prolyl cis-trans isomerase
MRKTLLLLLAALGCAAGAAAQEPATQDAAAESPRVARERIVLRTNVGDMVLALYPEVAPRHTEQLLKLARVGAYDGVNFFRVESSFVAQLSDARYKEPAPSPEQAAAIHPLPAEFSGLRHRRGTLSMARHDGRPDTGETSFSILLGDAPHLDGQYTVFGHLENGADVLDLIERAARRGNRPVMPLVVRRAEVVESPEALAALSLRRAGFYDEGVGSLGRYLTWGALAAILCGLLLFALSGRRAPVAVGSAGLLLVLVSAFGLFSAYVPRAGSSQWLGFALFMGVPVLFKLMNRFEGRRVGAGRPSTSARPAA